MTKCPTAKAKYSLAELMAQCDFNAPEPADMKAWESMEPTGNEKVSKMTNEIKVRMKHFGSPVSDVEFDCVIDEKARTIEITADRLDTYLLLAFVSQRLKDMGIDAITWKDGWGSRESRWQIIMIIGAYRHRVDIVEVFSVVSSKKEFTVVVKPAEPQVAQSTE